MLMCHDCKHTFEEDELLELQELADPDVGLSSPFVCPFCKSNDWDEVGTCAVCEKVIESPKWLDGLCEDCIRKYANPTTVVNADLRSGNKKLVRLPEFLAWAYNDKDIARILLNKLMEDPDGKTLAEEYVADDPDALAFYLRERGGD